MMEEDQHGFLISNAPAPQLRVEGKASNKIEITEV